MGEKYILDCPSCGPVPGYVPTDLEDDPSSPGDPDAVIDEMEFDGLAGPVVRVRCPRCGQWLPPDSEWPA